MKEAKPQALERMRSERLPSDRTYKESKNDRNEKGQSN
jgi:hypothetical protein